MVASKSIRIPLIAAATAFGTSLAVEVLAKFIVPEALSASQVYRAIEPHIHIVGYTGLGFIAAIYATAYYRLKGKVERENDFRDEVHDPVERVLGQAQRMIIDRQEDIDKNFARNETRRALQLIAIAIRHLVPKYTGGITAYIKSYEQDQQKLQVLSAASYDGQPTGISVDSHHLHESPSLPIMMKEKRNFNFWSRKRSRRASSVQPSAEGGISALVLKAPHTPANSIIGLLCINFTEDVEKDILIHEDLLSRWMPAIAERIYYANVYWKQLESRGNLELFPELSTEPENDCTHGVEA